MTLHRSIKRQADKIYTSYDYTYDGIYPPRVKGENKKQRQKVMRRYLKKDTENEIKNMNE